MLTQNTRDPRFEFHFDHIILSAHLLSSQGDRGISLSLQKEPKLIMKNQNKVL